MDKNELASFLAWLNGIYQRRDTTGLNSAVRGERCREINRHGILSLQAIGAITGSSVWQVEQAIVGMKRPKARGKLNPQHLSMLAYVLSTGKIKTEWLGIFLEEGTSLSTVADLTGIAESTLHRHRRKL